MRLIPVPRGMSDGFYAFMGAGCIRSPSGEILMLGEDMIRREKGELASEEQRLRDELESTADKLSDCWLHLDAYARGEPFTPEMAASILRHQKAPGWK